MSIRNELQLLDNAASEPLRGLRRDAMDILRRAVDAVDPRRAVMSRLELRDGRLRFDGVELDLEGFSRVSVVGGGKAGGAMAEASRVCWGTASPTASSTSSRAQRATTLSGGSS